jgi:hypothetical protein
MDEKAEKIALFRYGIIAPLVLETLPRGELTRRAQELAGRLYDIPHSTRRQVSVDTLLDWSLRYRRNGLAALSPKPRQDRGQARAVPQETAALIERLKRENPHRNQPCGRRRGRLLPRLAIRRWVLPCKGSTLAIRIWNNGASSPPRPGCLEWGCIAATASLPAVV